MLHPANTSAHEDVAVTYVWSVKMESGIFQSKEQKNVDTRHALSVASLNEALGESEEFALLRETLWIYSQIIASE
jgi:prenyltransferase beta subunit